MLLSLTKKRFFHSLKDYYCYWHSHWLLVLLLPPLYLAGLNKRLRLLAGCEQTPTLSITLAGQQMTQTRHLPFNDYNTNVSSRKHI